MLERLRAGFTRNKKMLAVLGAVAVAGIALVVRRTKVPTDSSAGTTTSSTSSTTSSTPYSTYTPYDSTASDVYSAIQPQLEQLQQMLASTPVPDTSIPDNPARESLGFFRFNDGGVRELYSDFTSRWVSAPEVISKKITPQATLSDQELKAFDHPATT